MRKRYRRGEGRHGIMFCSTRINAASPPTAEKWRCCWPNRISVGERLRCVLPRLSGLSPSESIELFFIQSEVERHSNPRIIYSRMLSTSPLNLKLLDRLKAFVPYSNPSSLDVNYKCQAFMPCQNRGGTDDDKRPQQHRSWVWKLELERRYLGVSLLVATQTHFDPECWLP